MWRQPDSAFAMLQEFASSAAADSQDEFNGHYCQLLVAELLFKNNYAQSNRAELLKAVHYFDSIVGMDVADARGKADTRGVSVQEREAFLDARAHYMNGVGFYERDSLVAACGEYLKALEMVETHFPNVETVCTPSLPIAHLPRFMALTYGRLGDLFSGQFMQEPAIVCYKKSLFFSKIEPTSANGIANLMSHLGNQYSILQQMDSARYYFNEAFKYLADTNNLAYRDLISGLALYNYYSGKSVESAVIDLKRMATQTKDEDERLTRFFTIGSIYFEIRQFDSAMVYLTRVFENKDNVVMKRGAARSLRVIFQVKGDTLKAAQYARYQVENPVHEGESNRQVSQLSDLFQTYLQEKQVTASLRERKKAVRTTLAVVLPLVVVLAAVVVILMRRRNKIRMVAQEAEAQRRLSEVSQQLSEASQLRDEAERELQTKVDQAAQHTREIMQQRVADIYQSNTKNRLQRIIEAVDETYPQAVAKLKEEHPELNETERHILLLNFLHFRIKEEADLLGLSENSIAKYRSNLGKTLGKDPVSDWI